MKETLLDNFLRISKITRESGHEEKIADFFVDVAKKNGLFYFKDEYNNVLIKKSGNKNKEPIAIQAHLDMVCVKKENSTHNFRTEGIEVIVNQDKVTAKDTSLGADQGVGLAMMLTIMEDKVLEHPNLEFILTAQEETTFKGAVNFPYSKVKSKRLINLDNAKDDSVFVGSDGDICNRYIFNGQKINVDIPSYKVIISGMPGGNSGDNVLLSLNNAITTMARLLKGKEVLLSSIKGGTCENDLATTCEVIISTNDDVYDIFEGQKYNIEKMDNIETFSKKDTENIIAQILDLKCGYISANNASANLGYIDTSGDLVTIDYVFRSMDEDELNDINYKTRRLNHGFRVKELYKDPIWKFDKDSKLLKAYRELYFKKYLEYPSSDISHCCTECAIMKREVERIDIISIGSKIEKFHTTDEVTYISSWIKVYECLVGLLEIIGGDSI